MIGNLTMGSLFTGYGGLDMAVGEVFGAKTSWVSDVVERSQKGVIGDAPRIIAARFPGVINLGDITKINWAEVEPVDIIAGGSPCQDVSLAGRRRGMAEGTRSGLWESMREGIDALKPRVVVWENVPGVRSAEAGGSLEPCPGCMGGGGGVPTLRALGRVLGDLAEVGYDAEWQSVRVSDLGGCHQRERLFVVAWRGYPPTPVGGVAFPPLALPRGSRFLPTPIAVQSNDGATVEQWAAKRSLWNAPLPVALRALPADGWGKYAGAIASHERLVGRPVPPPFDGDGKTSPVFVEWMMGLPLGWVSEVEGLSRRRKLRALGNGVVPQQADRALRIMLSRAGAGG